MQDHPTAALGHWGALGGAVAKMHTVTARRTNPRPEDFPEEFSLSCPHIQGSQSSLDPDQYQQNKRKLKEAILEHYQYVVVAPSFSRFYERHHLYLVESSC